MRNKNQTRRSIVGISKTATLLCLIPLVGGQLLAEGPKEWSLVDYFHVQEFSDFAVSNDGKFVAAEIWKQNLDENSTDYATMIFDVSSKPRLLFEVADRARHLSWHPVRPHLYYVSADNRGVQQIFVREFPHFRAKQLSFAQTDVTDFKLAPDGSTIVWRTLAEEGFIEARPNIYVKPAGLHEHLRSGVTGLRVDPETDSLKTFINPMRSDPMTRPRFRMFMSDIDHIRSIPLSVPLESRSYYWSPDSGLLSVTYSTASSKRVPFGGRFTAVGVFDLSTKEFRTIASAGLMGKDESVPSLYSLGPSYSGGQWVPARRKVFVMRPAKSASLFNPSNYEWTAFDVDSEGMNNAAPVWRTMHHYYSADSDYILLSEDELLSVKVVNGAKGLWRTSRNDLESVDIGLPDRSVSDIRASTAGEWLIFIAESATNPPELFVASRELGAAVQVTSLNSKTSGMSPVEPVHIEWTSGDGAVVGGWFFDACSGLQKCGNGAPLLTYIHGGPGADVTNGYSDIGFSAAGNSRHGKWAYPFELLVRSGISVFIPNYRPNPSYHEYRGTTPPSRERNSRASDDVLSGIQYLVESGCCDAKRLAVAGHSHGGWLGPHIATLSNQFEVGSFAEGGTNEFNRLLVNPGFLARGRGPEDRGIDGLVEKSPEFYFRGLKSAMLFESGARSGITGYLGAVKAARRANLPSELFLYPRAEHNSLEPAIQFSIASLNYDWFRFWLQGYEDSNPDKSEQYRRWREMRQERCSLPEAPVPNYCDFESSDYRSTHLTN